MTIEQLTQEELLKTLGSNQITIANKVYQGAWKINKGTRESLKQSIQDNTLQLCAVKQANALLDGKSITYQSGPIMYSHIFCSQNSQVKAYLHLKPENEGIEY